MVKRPRKKANIKSQIYNIHIMKLKNAILKKKKKDKSLHNLLYCKEIFNSTRQTRNEQVRYMNKSSFKLGFHFLVLAARQKVTQEKQKCSM